MHHPEIPYSMISALKHRIIMGTNEVTVYSKGGRILWVEGDTAHNYDALPFALCGRTHAQIGDTKYKCTSSDVCDLVDDEDVVASGLGPIGVRVVTFSDGMTVIVNRIMVLDVHGAYSEFWRGGKDIMLPDGEYDAIQPGMHMRVRMPSPQQVSWQVYESPLPVLHVREECLYTLIYPNAKAPEVNQSPRPWQRPAMLGFIDTDDLHPIV